MASLSADLELVRRDLESFITSGEINEDKVDQYNQFIDAAHQKKLEWALSGRYEPLNAIRIYGAYRLIHESLVGGKISLKEAKRRRENPTTAKRLLPYFSQLVLLSKMLESELMKEKEIRFIAIEQLSNELTSDAEALGILIGRQEYKKEIYEDVQKTVFESLSSDR